ncbi:DUF6660 family protein [Mesonia aestuariivivens]|uniref:Uncharacterized protein n=1 Tax=Mesonia aestuariivivens TaxID=2796128 RepID=A0ABS6VZV5_9FLAO|nr:DUF6660 family protein [Mesonia aestuariivivens]MBW2961133.1 hypothetical protein [Mesonia aestuariivivens]
MKILLTILSIYILGLNFIPCEDSITDIQEPTLAQATTSQDHENHQHSEDFCSPFCQCHCCHIHVIDFHFTEFQTIAQKISTQNFIPFENLGQEIHNRILQPPRNA